MVTLLQECPCSSSSVGAAGHGGSREGQIRGSVLSPGLTSAFYLLRLKPQRSASAGGAGCGTPARALAASTAWRSVPPWSSALQACRPSCSLTLLGRPLLPACSQRDALRRKVGASLLLLEASGCCELCQVLLGGFEQAVGALSRLGPSGHPGRAPSDCWLVLGPCGS